MTDDTSGTSNPETPAAEPAQLQLFEIKHRFSGAVLFAVQAVSLRAAAEAAALARAYLARAYLAGANLAGANLAGAYLARAYLAGANLAGANLAGAYLAGANLAGANLAGANLAGANLAGANLAGAYLAGAYLAGAYLAGANLAGANLAGAYLARAYLAGADDPVPVVQSPHRKILAAIEGGAGVFDMRDWHGEGGACGTTHCRAGWLIHLAGEAGRKLEDKLGPATAGLFIHLKSCPDAGMPNFYADNEEALADIRRCAELEPPIEPEASAGA